MITGVQDIWLPALDVSNFPTVDVDTEDEKPVPAKQRKTQEWVELFRATASPLAQRLAGLLASTHLTLSVIRLVQNALLPESGLAHLSEVLTSGLIYRVCDDESQIVINEPVFDFIPDARNSLRRRVTPSETLQVLEKVGEFISKKAGQGEGFAARVPSVAGTEFILNKQTLPFARITEEVLNSLGPIYRPLAQRLGGQIARLEEGIFQDLTFTFDVVEFVEPEPLPQFDFETVMVNARGEEVQREQRQAYYFQEALKEGVSPLEMVAIPAGSFLIDISKN